MRTLVVIPARLAAVRLPRKPLRLLAGLPLIVRVWQRVSQMNVADAVVVATDDESVASAVRAVGAECVMTSDEHTSGTERVAEVASHAALSRIHDDRERAGRRAVHRQRQRSRERRTSFRPGGFRSGRLLLRQHPGISLDTPSLVKVVVARRWARTVLLTRAEFRSCAIRRTQSARRNRTCSSTLVCMHTRATRSSRVGLASSASAGEHRAARAAPAAGCRNCRSESQSTNEAASKRNRYGRRPRARERAVARIHRGTVTNAGSVQVSRRATSSSPAESSRRSGRELPPRRSGDFSSSAECA